MQRFIKYIILCSIVLLASCSKKDSRDELLVFAAASLTDVFNSIASEFEKTHSSVNVQISFAGSQSLRTQIVNGAKPHIFASANAKHIDALLALDLVEPPTSFAENQMVIVVPKGNPLGILTLEQLGKAERLVLAGKAVPAGTYAEEILEKASKDLGKEFLDGVMKSVVSRETHVRQTLQKVILGEADAAIVYATDAASTMENVDVVHIPEKYNIKAMYPVTRLKGSQNSNADLFIAFLRSKMGREKLQLHGFIVP